MSTSRTVLVTGATGKQGGAVARALLARGHPVVGLTRNPETEAAVALEALGVRMVVGDFDKPDTLSTAMDGVDTVYAMGTPFEAGIETEVRQGLALADAVARTGVGHLIYGSVASADQATGVPHFESKYQVEKYIATLGIPYTISAPVAFMDTLLEPPLLDGLRQGTLQMAMPASTQVQFIAAADIGEFAARLVEQRDAVFGQRLEIAGDEVTGPVAAAAISRASGRDIGFVGFPPDALRAVSEDLALMFEWIDRTGYSVDRAAVQTAYPDIGWHSFEDWAGAQDWDRLLAPSGG